MPAFRTKTLSPQEANAFEADLRANGYREQQGATLSTLDPRRYFKRAGPTDPQTFGGPIVITFQVRD